MSINILNYNNLSVSDISFSTPVKIKGSYISLATLNEEEIYIQTPKLRTNGIQKTDIEQV